MGNAPDPEAARLVADLRRAVADSRLSYRQLSARTELSTGTIERALSSARINVPTLLRLCSTLDRAVVIHRADGE